MKKYWEIAAWTLWTMITLTVGFVVGAYLVFAWVMGG